jgi:2-keto-3-deoxy-L-rhamnonate aldolase RhmA
MPVSNRVKERLARGETALCMATRLARTPEIAMIADACGFDAFFIDMEHSAISLDAAAAMCTAAVPVGIAPLVRVAGHVFHDATRLLDLGAMGIICPDVETGEQAQAFAAACKFPPLGARSVGGVGPLQGYRSTPLGEVNAQGNEATLLVAMLESPQGIVNADAIAAVPGIDVLLIGSNDLCTAMGIPGELKHPKLRAAYEATMRACAAQGKCLGIGGIRADVSHVAELVQLGARFVIAASDIQYLMAAARSEVAALRKAAGG